MWYTADVLMATDPGPDGTAVCHLSKVLLDVPTAVEAYDKAVSWAKGKESCTFHLVGIMWVSKLDEHRPGDGDSVACRYERLPDPWKRMDELIPYRDDILSIKVENDANTPVTELLSEEQTRRIKRLFGEE